MKIRARQLASLGLAVAVLAVPGARVDGARSAKAAARKKPTLKARLRTQLHGLVEKMNVVRVQLHETKKEEARVSDLLQESLDRLELAQRRLRLAKEQVAAAQREVAAARKRLQIAEERLRKHQRELSRRLAASYMMGTVTYADVLLGSRSLGDFLDRRYLVEKVLDSDVSLLRKLRAAQEQVERERAALERKRVRLAAAQQAILFQIQNVLLERAARAKLLAQIQTEREYQERVLDELEEDSNNIAARLRAEELRRRIRRGVRGGGGSSVRWSGRFTSPAEGRITSGFGYRMHPILRYVRFHSGLDIGAGYGAPVRAAADGEVFEAGFYRGYGRCIIILHDGEGRISTLYGHLSAIYVQSGTVVRQGQMIGRVGSTGLSTGPHLHFEVREYGVPKNPALWTTR